MDEEREKRLLFLVILLLVIAAIAVTVSVLTFRERDRAPILTPDYAPGDPEKNAEPIGDDGDEKLDQPEGGGAVSLTYAKEVAITKAGNTATLLFANPQKSNQDMVLELVIDDAVVFRSGRIAPGHKVTSLTLSEGIASRLVAGGYDGRFVVFYYDRSTGERAMLNTEIPVTVTVKE